MPKDRIKRQENVVTAKALLIVRAEVVDADVPAFVDALQKAGLHPEVVTYPSVQHGFDDDSAPARFAPETAKLAWSRTVEFLRHTIG